MMSPEEMREKMNDQINKIMSFNEDNSKKIIALKKFILSPLVLVFLILFICAEAFDFIDTIISFIANSTSINASSLMSLIFTSLISVVIPGLIIGYFFKLRSDLRSEKYSKKNNKSLLDSLAKFRSYIKILFILLIILNFLNGFTYYNLPSLMDNAQFAEQLKELGITREFAELAKIAGAHMIFKGAIDSFFLLSLMRSTKFMFRSIIFDKSDNALNDFFVLSGTLIIYGVSLLIGLILMLCGISTPLSEVKPGAFNVYPDLFYIFEKGSLIIFVLFSAVLPILLRKELINNTGFVVKSIFSEGSKVYTIKLDQEINEFKY